MKKRLLLMLAAFSIVSVSAAAFYRSNKTDDGPHLVTTAVTRGDVVETVQATGTLQAVTTVQVGTQVSGTIKTLKADFNSEVRRGQVVAELDPSLFQTQVDQAQATVVRLQSEVAKAKVDLADAEMKLKRAVELKARQLIPETDFETAQTTASSAQAAVRSAEAQVVQAIASLKQNQVNLDHTIITAPIDGIVISRNVDVGQTVAASMQAPVLFTIAKDLTEMQVSASIDESDIGRIANGQTVTFRVDAYPTETFKGTVAQVRLQPVIDQNVVSYATVINVPNPEMKLKPGMTATVTVQVARNDGALRVPSAALSFRPTAEVLAAFGRQAPEQQAENVQAGNTQAASETPQRASARQGRSTDSAEGRPAGSAQNAGERRGSRPSTPLGAALSKVEGRVWVMADGQLRPVRVQTGVSDGITTAIVGGDLPENAEIVTGVANRTATTATQTTGSPLLPFGNRNRQGAGGAQRPGAGR